MLKKILAILPESIGGRLTMTSLFRGFEKCGYKLTIVDKLDSSAKKQVSTLNIEDYDFLISYDFVAIEFKTDLDLKIKTVNYFSDVIESDCSGKYWQKYYAQLQDKDNYIFYWDKSLTQKANKSIANIHYLPHCVDIETYKNLNLKNEYDVMFAGRLTYGTRVERFLKLVKALPNVKFALYCFEKHLDNVCEQLNETDSTLLHSVYKGFIDTEEKMSEAINKSKIVLNFTSQGESSLNYRLFQVLACEKLLLTDYRQELGELFTIDEDVIFYKNDKDIIEKIKDYLINSDKYKKIIQNGRKIIEVKYSCSIASRKILDILNTY